MRDFNSRKFFLYLLIGSVGISAVIGILVILFGTFGDFETKVLLTALTITVTSILGLACGAYLETRRAKVLPLTGIACAIIAAVMWIYLIWHGRITDDLFVKSLMSATLIGVSCSHISLLSLARLDGRFVWTKYAVHGAVWSLTAVLLFVIWDRRSHDLEIVGRIIGVLSIVVASLTVVTPILHKLSHTATGTTEIDAELADLRKRIDELEARKAASSKAGASSVDERERTL